jgi:hypothetical protein
MDVKLRKRVLAIVALAVFMLLLSGCGPQAADTPTVTEITQAAALARDSAYTTKEDVALYLHLYGELPDNFITKVQARALGWDGGGLHKSLPASASAATHSAILKACSPKPMAESIISAISTPWARTAAVRSASCIQATG